MPEETQAPPNEDTPEAPEGAAPEAEGTPAEESQVDFEKRYNDLRPEFDRTRQQLSEYSTWAQDLAEPESPPDALHALGYTDEEIAQAMGWDFEEDKTEGDEEYVDPEDRVAALEEYLAQQREAQEAEKAEAELADLEEAYLEQELGRLEEEHGELTEAEAEAIAGLAAAYPDENGLPDYQGAYETFTGATQASRQRYLDSKKAASIGRGTAGSEKVDMNDENERVKYAASILEAESSED